MSPELVDEERTIGRVLGQVCVVGGLADPANLTLITLNVVTSNLVASADDIAVEDFIGAKVIRRLIDEAQTAFQECHDAVETAGRSGEWPSAK